MSDLIHIRTNIKTSEDTWRKFRAICIKKGSRSGDVLGYFINLANDNRLDVPIIDNKNIISLPETQPTLPAVDNE